MPVVALFFHLVDKHSLLFLRNSMLKDNSYSVQMIDFSFSFENCEKMQVTRYHIIMICHFVCVKLNMETMEFSLTY